MRDRSTHTCLFIIRSMPRNIAYAEYRLRDIKIWYFREFFQATSKFTFSGCLFWERRRHRERTDIRWEQTFWSPSECLSPMLLGHYKSTRNVVASWRRFHLPARVLKVEVELYFFITRRMRIGSLYSYLDVLVLPHFHSFTKKMT